MFETLLSFETLLYLILWVWDFVNCYVWVTDFVMFETLSTNKFETLLVLQKMIFTNFIKFN